MQALRSRAFGVVALVAALAGCTASGPAPVVDRSGVRTAVAAPPASSQIVASTSGFHTVQRGDTLYAIAFANGLDYREVAIWNRLESPDRILVGQVLRLTPPADARIEIRPLDEEPLPQARPLAEPPEVREPQGVLLPYSDANWAQVNAPKPAVAATPAPAPTPASAPPTARPATAEASVDAWLWPAEGALVGRYGGNSKGIQIAGERNTPVVAVAPGKVVYSGTGLRGYGRLLIVKHADEYLSAYAHNETILVKEGEQVTAGQRIALMGDSGTDRVKLHFEIRRYGKPLDPLNFLPERS